MGHVKGAQNSLCISRLNPLAIGTHNDFLFFSFLFSNRCHRLKKSCSAQTPAPARKRKAPKPTRVADLERRLEDLTARVGSQALLGPTPPDGDLSPFEGGEQQASPPLNRIKLGERPLEGRGQPCFFDPVVLSGGREQQQQQASSGSRRTSDIDDDMGVAPASQESQAPTTERAPEPSAPMWRAGNTHFPFTYEFANEPQNTLQSRCQDPQRPQPSSSSTQANSSSSSITTTNRPGREDPNGDPWYYPAPLEAQQLLANHRSHMAPLFPFVVIPPGMTAAQLRAQRPLLWKATMTASLYLDAARQLFLGRELLNDIVATAFLQPRKSFDLVQALQILVAWCVIQPTETQGL